LIALKPLGARDHHHRRRPTAPNSAMKLDTPSQARPPAETPSPSTLPEHKTHTENALSAAGDVARALGRLPGLLALGLLVVPGVTLAQDTQAPSATDAAALEHTSTEAFALPRGLQLGLRVGLGQDSNPLNQPDGQNPQKDDWRSLGVTGGLDLHVGRQRLYAQGSAEARHYSQHSVLNQTAHELTAGMDWLAALPGLDELSTNTLRGRLLARQTRTPNPDPVAGLSNPGQQNPQTRRLALAQVETGAHSAQRRLGLEAQVWRDTLNYGAENYASQNTRQNAQLIGLRWLAWGDSRGSSGQAAPHLLLRLGLRHSRSERPQALDANASVTPEQTDRHSRVLGAVWQASANSRLSARLDFSDENQAQAERSSHTHIQTGALNWAWTPSGRLALQAGFSRSHGELDADPGAEGASPWLLSGLDATREARAWTLGLSYRLSAKLGLEAQWRRSNSQLLRPIRITPDGASDDGADHTTRASARAIWQATPTVDLSCSVMTQWRRTQSPLSSKLSANGWTCGLNWQRP
jgi:hypothetical protein